MAEQKSSALTAPLRGAASALRRVPGAGTVTRAAEETLDKVGVVSPRGRRIAVYAGAGMLGAAGVVEWPVALTGAAVAWLTQPRPPHPADSGKAGSEPAHAPSGSKASGRARTSGSSRTSASAETSGGSKASGGSGTSRSTGTARSTRKTSSGTSPASSRSSSGSTSSGSTRTTRGTRKSSSGTSPASSRSSGSTRSSGTARTTRGTKASAGRAHTGPLGPTARPARTTL